MIITAEEFRTAAKVAASIGYTGSAEEYNQRASDLELALTEDAVRDEIFDYFESLYFGKDLDLRESVNGVLDMLKADAGLQLTTPLVDYDREYVHLDGLDRNKTYTDKDGDRVEYRENRWGDVTWSWQSSDDEYWRKSFEDHGPFKLAR